MKNKKVVDFLVHLYSFKQKLKFYGIRETIKYYARLIKRKD